MVSLYGGPHGKEARLDDLLEQLGPAVDGHQRVVGDVEIGHRPTHDIGQLPLGATLQQALEDHHARLYALVLVAIAAIAKVEQHVVALGLRAHVDLRLRDLQHPPGILDHARDIRGPGEEVDGLAVAEAPGDLRRSPGRHRRGHELEDPGDVWILVGVHDMSTKQRRVEGLARDRERARTMLPEEQTLAGAHLAQDRERLGHTARSIDLVGSLVQIEEGSEALVIGGIFGKSVSMGCELGLGHLLARRRGQEQVVHRNENLPRSLGMSSIDGGSRRFRRLPPFDPRARPSSHPRESRAPAGPRSSRR